MNPKKLGFGQIHPKELYTKTVDEGLDEKVSGYLLHTTNDVHLIIQIGLKNEACFRKNGW